LTRYLLDTNVISDALRPRPSPALAAWMSDQIDTDLFISTLSLAEIQRGILQLPLGRRRNELEAWYAGRYGPTTLFGERIFAFDVPAAGVWARLMAEGNRRGSPRSAVDMIVAAIAIAHDCTVVTANERHFGDVVSVLNPART
jgi:hypothetical protein